MTDLIKSDARYLHGEDLRRGSKRCDVTLTIKEVGEHNSAKDSTGRVIAGYPVTFAETEKILVLNETNRKLAVAELGTNSRGEWAGRKLTFYPAMLKQCFGQRNVECVRVRLTPGKVKPWIKPEHMGEDLVERGATTQ